MEGSCHEAGSDCILKQKKRGDKREETGNKRIRGVERTRKRAQWNTPEKTKPARQDGLAGEERGSEREGENVRTTEKGGGRRSSWHTADVSSITVSPPSGGRSEELPPPSSHPAPLSFSVLGSPELLCNEAGRGMKGGGWRGTRDLLSIYRCA